MYGLRNHGQKYYDIATSLYYCIMVVILVPLPHIRSNANRAADVVRSTGQLVAITVAKKSFQLKRERRQAKLFEQERLQAQQRARDIAEGRGYEDDGITTDEERVKNLARERRRSRDHRRTGGGGGGGGGGGNGSGSAVQGRFNPEPYEEVSVSRA